MKPHGSPFSIFTFLFLTSALIYIISITGRNNTLTNTAETDKNQARSEQDFVANRDLKASLGSVIAIHLEDVNSTPNDIIPDTGTIGEDIIYIRYTENAFHTIRMESSAHFDVYLENVETGGGVYYVSPIYTSVYVYIPAGDYKMKLRSWVDYSTDSLVGRQTIFIQPEGDVYHTFISTGGCPGCDLRLVNLSHMFLNGMNFGGADFNKADLGHTNLTGSNLSSAKLNETYLYQSAMQYSDISNSSARGVILRGADLRYAGATGSDFTNGDFRFADVSSVNFCGSVMAGIIYNGIVYNGETQCWP